MGGEYSRKDDIKREKLEGSGYERSGCPCADCEDQHSKLACKDCGKDNNWELFEQVYIISHESERKDEPRGINYAFAAVNNRYGRSEL